MLLKKVLFTFIFSACCLGFCACSFSRNNVAEDISEHEQAKSRTDEIVNALEAGDSEKIKTVFSENVRNKVTSLDDDIALLFNYFRGKVQSVDYGVTNTNEEVSHGDKKKTLLCGAEIKTDEEEYILYFEDIVTDTKEEGEKGVNRISLVKSEDVEKYQHNEYDIEGVFTPLQVDEKELENRRQKVYDMNPEFFDEHPDALEYFRLFEEYPDIFKEQPTVFEKYPSILDNLEYFEKDPESLVTSPDLFE